MLDDFPYLAVIVRKRLARAERKAHTPIRISPLQADSKKKSKKQREKFLRSDEWQKLRTKIFERDGRCCAKCGNVKQLNIDHILPRSKFPELALDEINLRVLCWNCNKAKACKIEIDVIL